MSAVSLSVYHLCFAFRICECYCFGCVKVASFYVRTDGMQRDLARDFSEGAECAFWLGETANNSWHKSTTAGFVVHVRDDV